MLERLVAGVLVIGVLLWGASIIATPDAPFDQTPREIDDPFAKEGAPDPPSAEVAPAADTEADVEADDHDERSEKGKKRGRDG